MKKWQVAFYKGEMVYEVEYNIKNKVTYKDNFVFTDTLTFDRFIGGRERFNAIVFHNNDNKNFYMFMNDFGDLVKLKTLINGTVEGEWIFCNN